MVRRRIRRRRTQRRKDSSPIVSNAFRVVMISRIMRRRSSRRRNASSLKTSIGRTRCMAEEDYETQLAILKTKQRREDTKLLQTFLGNNLQYMIKI
jgi:hypothetical protein